MRSHSVIPILLAPVLFTIGCSDNPNPTVAPNPVAKSGKLVNPNAAQGFTKEEKELVYYEVKLAQMLQVRAHNISLILKKLDSAGLLNNNADKITAQKLADNIHAGIKLLWADGKELPKTFTDRVIINKVIASADDKDKKTVLHKIISDTNTAGGFINDVFEKNPNYVFSNTIPDEKNPFPHFQFAILAERDINPLRGKLLGCHKERPYTPTFFNDMKVVNDTRVTLLSHNLYRRISDALKKERTGNN